jgi:hypothetical protein
VTEESRRLVMAFKAAVEATEPEERMQILLAVMSWATRAYEQTHLAGQVENTFQEAHHA